MIDPIAFTIFGRPIYWYGIFVALGFLAAMFHWNRAARRLGLPESLGSDLAFVTMIAGILGARAMYVVANWDDYSQHPWSIPRIDQGGLIFYGGFLAAAVAIAIMARIRNIPTWTLGDFTVSALPLGHAFGRIGCLLNGCCYGAPCALPWAVFTAGTWRHPVQGYEAAFNLVLYIALRRLLLRRAAPGSVTAVYLVAYGAWRFFIEFFRGDPRMAAWAGLNAAQALSLAFVIAGLALGAYVRARARLRS